MKMTSLILLYLSVALLSILDLGLSAKCGNTEYFQYKFRPLSMSPNNPDNKEVIKKRCGEGRCDYIVMLYGEPKCKKGAHGIQIKGPENTNMIAGEQFKPDSLDWKTHSDWRLTDAASTPLRIEVCDEDGGLRGGNDALLTIEHEQLEEGCSPQKKMDDDFFFVYEICCRPIE